MPIGYRAQDALQDYLMARQPIARQHPDLWLTPTGRPMTPDWVYLMLKRLASRAGGVGFHTHRTRHTYTVNALDSGVPLPIIELAGGWKRIPETYLRTLGRDHVSRALRGHSVGDRLGTPRTAPRRGGRSRL